MESIQLSHLIHDNMVRNELDWKRYSILRFSWALLILMIVFSFPFIPERYINIHIVFLILLVFLSFIMFVIERRKILLVFPNQEDEDSSSPSPMIGGPYSNSSSHSINPLERVYTLHRVIINEKILFPYLDIGFLIIGMFLSVIMLLISIFNILLILGSVALYYIILDNMIKRYGKGPIDEN